MDIKLYALKCKDGYLKVSNTDCYHCVEMDKASVFPLEKFTVLKENFERAKNNGMVDVRIVELIVTENEDFIPSQLSINGAHRKR